MGALKNLPVVGIVLQLLFLLVGLPVGLEVYGAADIFLPRQHMGNRAVAPLVIISGAPIV